MEEAPVTVLEDAYSVVGFGDGYGDGYGSGSGDGSGCGYGEGW